MCLGIPMQISEINGYTARCQARGIERDVNLFLLQDKLPSAGDYVMVHVGYAIQVIAETHALEAWDLYDQAQSGPENPDA